MKKWMAFLVLCVMTFTASAAKTILLPRPQLRSMPLNRALQKRRSIRSFRAKKLSLKQISTLLWAAQGITNKRGFRTAPSAGALYPLELYVVKNDGVWHYNPKQNTLTRISSKDLRAQLSKAAYNQHSIIQAPVNFVIAAVFARVTKKYGRKGIRFSYIEAGHAAQNLVLESTSLKLGAVAMGGFQGFLVEKVLGLPRRQKVLYIIPVGHSK